MIQKLSEVPAGKYFVVDIGNDSTVFARRMVQLGLYKSVEIKKLKNSNRSTMIIKMKGAKYIIGKNRADKTYVVKK